MNHARIVLAGWVVLNLAGWADAAAHGRTDRQYRTIAGTLVVGDVGMSTLRAALEVLPRKPQRIDIVDDRKLPAAVRTQVEHMDAFVPEGGQTIYLRRQSPTLREAEFAGGPYTLMLALVLWHEMAHADGLDERGARSREEGLWHEFIRAGRVEGGLGLAYLRELQARK